VSGGARNPQRSVTSRALAVLRAFDDRHRRLTLSEVARRAELPLSTAHRLVTELVDGEALQRRADGSYVVGRWLWHLGLLAPVQVELRELALPFLQDLYDATRENVHLAVRDGRHALYVERVSGRTSVPVVSRAGGTLPLHATGVGKVLLAHAPDEVRQELLGGRLERVTRHTVVEPGRLQRELAEVRRRGYARTSEEMTLGANSLAVPVLGADGDVVAALGVVTGTLRKDLPRLAPALQVAAAGITRRLGRLTG
jgi:DNA-binding IclR family transcriptional regulator